MKRALPIALLLTLFAGSAVCGATNEDPLPWLNGRRADSNIGALGVDTVLMRTAQDYSEKLAASGRISHAGPDGSDALSRFLREGGTSARVGEILGAGENLSTIEAAWLASSEHRQLILRPYWTHAGWGHAQSGDKNVWVVLFVQKRMEDLEVNDDGAGGIEIQGILLPSDVVRPILISGTVRVDATAWDSGQKRFLFRLPSELLTGYVRLGYLSRDGKLVITDVITSPRGTESPAAGSRS